jgi:hypothetical protein
MRAIRLWASAAAAVLFSLVVIPTFSGVSSAATANKSPIEIGIETQQGLQSAQANVGGQKQVAAVTPTNTTSQAEAMISWLNAHGGLGGHKVEGVYVAGLPNPTRSGTDQLVCTSAFQSNHVYAYMETIGASETEPACFKEHKGIFLDNVINTINPSEYTKSYNPYLFSPLSMNIDDEMATIGHEVVANGWNNPSYKVAVLTALFPDSETAVNKVLLPYLKKHNVNVVDTEFLPGVEDPTTFANAQAPANNAVLKLKSLGVDHIIVPLDGYYFEPVFAPKALAQGLNAIYAFFGTNPFQGVAFSSDPVKAIYQNGDLVVGASSDATFGTNPPVTPVETQCNQMYNSQGLAVPLPTPGATVGPAYTVCDEILFLQAAFKHGATTNPTSFKAAVGQLGTSLQFGTVHHIDFTSADPYNPITQVRDGVFSSDCGCFNAIGSWHAETQAS